MTVRNVLEVTATHTDVKIYHENRGFSIIGTAGKILETADFLMKRKVAQLEIHTGMSFGATLVLTLAAEENE